MILLLGPARDRHRLMGPDFVSGPDITVIERDDRYKADWPGATYIEGDLKVPHAITLPASTYSEVHAYEVLNLLPGDEWAFYAFWRWLWTLLKPAGQVYASVPHWESRYIHAYPGQQRVYTPELIQHLNQDTMMPHQEDFSNLWPRPYCFKHVLMIEGDNHDAFYFRLAKC